MWRLLYIPLFWSIRGGLTNLYWNSLDYNVVSLGTHEITLLTGRVMLTYWLNDWLAHCVIKWLSEWQSVILSINQSVGQLTGWLTDCVGVVRIMFLFRQINENSANKFRRNFETPTWNQMLSIDDLTWFFNFLNNGQQCWFPSFRCSLSCHMISSHG